MYCRNEGKVSARASDADRAGKARAAGQSPVIVSSVARAHG
jgi:hypothetical protein